SMGTKGKIIMTLCILILFGFLFVIGLGERGAVDLYKLKLERYRLHRVNLDLRRKSHALYRTIQRLKDDPDFVESIARSELGMIGKDEVVLLRKKR
ncbi:MAG: septum formation initiator family protein, partial [Desulfobacterales bacterium]|nr:septum formation initiator family protein [Desulfobacterales bacterium]